MKNKLPKGYRLKSGVEYDKDLKRYLWNPQPNDLFLSPRTKRIFKYLKWGAKPENVSAFMVLLDGYGKIKELKKKESFWVNNMLVRQCIPIEKC